MSFGALPQIDPNSPTPPGRFGTSDHDAPSKCCMEPRPTAYMSAGDAPHMAWTFAAPVAMVTRLHPEPLKCHTAAYPPREPQTKTLEGENPQTPSSHAPASGVKSVQ